MKLKNITDEATRKSFGQELALDANGVLDNLVDSVLDGLVDQVPEHEAGEVCVKPLVLPDLDGVNVEALHLTEDVLHHYLEVEAIEAS